MFLTAEQIAQIVSPTESVSVEGVGVFNVRGLTAKETESLDDRDDSATRILLMGLVDESGKRLFGEDKLSVVENLPQRIAKPIQEAILRLSGQKTKGFDPGVEAEKK
jgi:hypothetical protein